jgi:uncharacterized membrane protein
MAEAPEALVEEEVPSHRRSRLLLAGFLMFMGTLHFVVPKPFDRLIPGTLGAPRAWTYASGLTELTSGALLVRRRTARLGGLAAAATFVAVFPGNIKMAVDTGLPGKATDYFPWLRLPFQLPLIMWAWRQRTRA